MKGALLTKAVLCACPPALAVGAIATVPPVRKAVHHITSSKKPVTRTRARPQRQRVAPVAARPCLPAPVFAAFEIPLALPADVLAVSPLSQLISASSSEGTRGPGSAVGTPVFLPGVSGVGGVIGGTPTPPPGGGEAITPTPGTDVVPPIPAVPEPATWAMMLIGFGLVGGLLRRRAAPLPLGEGRVRTAFPLRISKRLRLTAAAGEGGVLMADSGSTFALVTTPVGSTAVAKALFCICPVALMTVAATTVPGVRDAVHRGTAAPSSSSFSAPQTIVPCDPVAAAQKALIQVSTPALPATEAPAAGSKSLAGFPPTSDLPADA